MVYGSGSQSVVRVPLVVRELPLVVRRGISELNINQAACPPKRFFLIVLNGSVFFMLSTRRFFLGTENLRMLAFITVTF